jgi:hypothetical protein
MKAFLLDVWKIWMFCIGLIFGVVVLLLPIWLFIFGGYWLIWRLS